MNEDFPSSKEATIDGGAILDIRKFNTALKPKILGFYTVRTKGVIQTV